MSEGNFEVPAADAQKLLDERAQATKAAFDGAPSPAPSAPAASAAPSLENMSPEQLRAIGEAWPGLEPAETEALLDGIMNPILEWRNKAPLSPTELTRGGKALTPALNKWAPYILKQHGDLVIAALWIAGVVRTRRNDPEELGKLRTRVAELEKKEQAKDEVTRLRARVQELEKAKAAA